MARVTSYEESKQYETSSGFEIFSLMDDGDSDKVQFLADSLDDVLIYTTHEVPMKSQNGRDYQRKVRCLKQHSSDPQGTCPMCDSGAKVKLARFMPMYSHSQQKVVLWERSGQFLEKNIGSLLNRLKSQGKSPKDVVVEIVRCGRKGDTKTTYQFYPLDAEQPASLEGLEIPDPEGSLIATWSIGEMHNYVANGIVPTAPQGADNSGVARRESRVPEAPAYNNAPAYGNTTGAPAPSTGTFTGAPVSDPTSMF